MRPLLATIHKELRALGRDVHGLLVLFVMPAVFILVMSLALRDTFQPRIAEKARWQVWDGDASEASAALRAALPAARPVAESREGLEAQLARREIQLGLLIDAGYEEALADPETKRPLVTVLAEPGLPPAVLAAFQADVLRVVAAQRVNALVDPFRDTARISGIKLPDMDPGAAAALLETRFFRATEVPLTSVQQSVPAWLVFAMFFVVIPLSNVFIAERQHGTWQRLRSLRVPVATLLAGKVVPFYAVNLGQTLLMLAVGHSLVPRLGGDALQLDVSWPALWLMATAVSLAGIGFALAVASVARTTEQATTIGGVTNILFAALGGVMVPKIVMPLAMQRAAAFSPMGWGLEGFLDVFVRGAGLGGLGAEPWLLFAFAAACLGVAWWRMRRVE